MNEQQTLYRLRQAMVHINFIIISFLTLFFTVTSYKIAANYQSISFFDQVSILPMEPWKMPVYMGCLLLLLLGIFVLKETTTLYYEKLYLFLIVEFILCLMIIKCLYFQYNGIMLVIIIDFISSHKNQRYKYVFVIVVAIVYVAINIDIIPIYGALSIEKYLAYYALPVRYWINTFLRVIISLNNLLFMMHVFMMMRFQVIENNRIACLNKKLDDTNEQLISAGLDAMKVLMQIDMNEARRQLEKIGQLARAGIEDVRRSVKALRPDALERLPLVEAIHAICEEYEQGIEITLHIDEPSIFDNMAQDEEETIYRLVQEALTNAVRHGKASKIRIYISREFNHLMVYINDNGMGSGDKVEEGFGLIHMKERVYMLGGNIEYRNKEQGTGFIVQAHIPIRWGEK